MWILKFLFYIPKEYVEVQGDYTHNSRDSLHSQNIGPVSYGLI